MQIFKLGLSFSGFALKIIEEILIYVDSGLYKFAANALSGFYDVVKLSSNFFGEANSVGMQAIQGLLHRITLLAGIYALFKLSLLMISYMIEPSKIKNAEKAGLDIAKNTFIAIILLGTSSFIFGKLGEFQSLIIEENVIENIVYGVSSESSGPDIGNAGEENDIKSRKFVNNVWLLFLNEKASSTDISSTCQEAYNNVKSGEAEIKALVNCTYKYYSYFPIAPFIIGILLIYYFIMACLEMATRLIKLLVLEVIFPIPVIMSIDPGSKNKLKNFYNAYLPIYLQVFIRIITFYLAFSIASLVLANASELMDLGTGQEIGLILKIIIIIGVFQGMKELPKLIENAIGVKLNGGGNAKPFGQVVKGIVAGGLGFAGGAVIGGITGGFGGAVAGSISGTRNAWKDASANNGKSIKDSVMSASVKGGAWGTKFNNAGGMFNYAGGVVRNMFGGQARDKKTLEGFDKKSDGIRKNIGEMQGNMNDINRSAQLRDNLERVMENRFIEKNGSLNEAYANNMAVQRGQALIDAEIAKGDNANWKMVESYTESLNQLKENVKAEYETKQQKYYNEQLDLASKGGGANLDADIGRAYNQAKSYDQSAGLTDRNVTSMADLQKLREGDMTKIADLENQIRAKNAEIDDINRQKKEFEGSTKFKAGKAAAKNS